MTSTKTHSSPFDKDLAEALCSLELPKQIKFSPNGCEIVYATSLQRDALRKGKHRTSTLWAAQASKPGSTRKLTSGETNDVSPVWHPEGKYIAFLSDRATPGAGFAIWTLCLDGSAPVLVSGSDKKASVGTFAFSPDGETIAYTSADEKSTEQQEREEKRGGAVDPKVWGEDAHLHLKLRLLRLETGVVRTLDTENGHIVDFSWNPNGQSIVFGSVQNLDSEEMHITGTSISTVVVGDSKVAKVCTVSKYADNLTWAPDGKIYYINRAVENSCWSGNAVYAVDPAQLAPTPIKVLNGEDDEPSNLNLACGRVLVTRDIRNGTLISEVSGQRVFERNLNFFAYDAHYDTETSTWVFAVSLSDINTPPEVIVVQDVGQTCTVLSEHGKVFKDRKFGSFHVLSCPSSDGAVELDGIYLTPAGVDNSDGKPTTPLPTAVFIHGGPMARNHNQFDCLSFYWVPYLLAKGYGVLLPQYRGSTGRGSRFAAYTMTGHGRENYDDIITITDNAIHKGFADCKRLLVGGWSMGGLMAYLCSVRNGRHGLGWRFNAAVAGAGICDMDSTMLESDVGSTAHSQMSGGRPPWLRSESDTSARCGSALWQVAGAVDEARRSSEMVIPPMLILHGEQDSRAPFTQAQGFRRALRAHKLLCEFVAYPGQGHTPGPMSYWLDMLERVARFCDVYIAPRHQFSPYTADRGNE